MLHIVKGQFCRKAIMDIYKNVKKIADRKGFSIRELERMAGIGNGRIRHWNEQSPTVDSLLKVAKALGVYPERLLK